MGWFDKKAAPPSPAQSGPTIDTVRALLEEIGQFRLSVKSPEMKVLLTQIAWNGESYLMRQAAGSQPTGAQLVRMSSGLQTVLQVVQAFAQHEQLVPQDEQTYTRLATEIDAVKQYATSLLTTSTTSGFAAGFNADVNTDLLNRLTQAFHQ